MWGRKIISAIAVSLTLAAPVIAQDRTVLLPQASEALAAGEATTALALVNQAIAANPRDIDALLLKSQILFAMGQVRAAREAAHAAFQGSDIPAARYASAVRMADIIARQKNYSLSMFWLRRAAQYAQNDAEMEQLVAAYRHVKQKSPWRFGLSVGAAPNSNINNGSSEQIIWISGLPFVLSPTARALSGYTAEAQASLEYRLFQTERSATTVSLTGGGRMNWLDSTSRATAPGVSGHDFDFYTLALTAMHRQIVGQGIQLEFNAKVGRNWYGRAKLSDFFGAGVAATFPIAQGRDALTVTARADRNLLVQGGLVAETVTSAGVIYGHKLPWGDTLIGRASYTQNFSANATQQYRYPQVGFDYRFSRPILGAQLEVGANYGYKNYPVAPLSATGRQDHIVTGRVSADFRKLTYLGFSPVLSLEAKRSWSNIAIHTQQTFSGGIRLQSRF